MTYGFERACHALEVLGVRHVFGVPGTQSVHFYEGLRRSRLHSILTASELGAAFAAGAYGRVSGKPGVMVAIPGPGFAYALPGLAEAKLDSAPMVLLTWSPPDRGHAFDLQAIDQRTLAGALAKDVVEIVRQEDIEEGLVRAYSIAQTDEPGPVVVQFTNDALVHESSGPLPEVPPPVANAPAAAEGLVELSRRLEAARRAVILAGQGASGVPEAVRELAEALSAPVVTTPSGRGVIAEDHPLAMRFDVERGGLDDLNALLDAADLVVVLGAKLGHNGSAGFGLRIDRNRLVRVDSSERVLGGDYPGALEIRGEVGCVLKGIDRSRLRTGWSDAEIAGWRRRIHGTDRRGVAEPMVDGQRAEVFFGELRSALPSDAILVTDSGLHQVLARRYFDTFAPHGLLMPSDFQSMGFGLPAAIGAKLAAPERAAVAIIGDGSLGMTGFELATAVREQLAIPVIVFHDGKLNLIRVQQMGSWGRTEAVDLPALDLEAFAVAVGANYCLVKGVVRTALERALRGPGPTLLEVRVGDSIGLRALHATRLIKESVRSLVPDRLLRRCLRFRP